MEPLAYALRPKTIDEIVGQKHLVGPNGAIRRLLNSNKITSLIFYGDPGIGKTTIAKAIVNTLNVKYDTFNASSDNKEKLKRLIEKDNNNILIIDEIHRMKKDIQDYLLFTHKSEEPGVNIILDYLKEKTFLNMNMRLGEGTGAVLAYPIIACAIEMINTMKSPEEVYKLFFK